MRSRMADAAGSVVLAACLVAAFPGVAGEIPGPGAGEGVIWQHQIGTSAWDKAYGVASDGAGDIAIAGYTYGSLGRPDRGRVDAFLAKYDAAGKRLWIRQLGTDDWDEARGGVAMDAAGNVAVAGGTGGSLGGPQQGLVDAFVAKFDAAGTRLWARQLGTGGYDDATGVAMDASSGAVVISGYTYGSLFGLNPAGADGFVAAYDGNGKLQWADQFGTESNDYATGVAVDGAGNVVVAGHTEGALGGLNKGRRDAFLVKYDAAGNRLWRRQLGTSATDVPWGVATDSTGNVVIAGATLGSLVGPNKGGSDGFVAKYDPAGARLWIRQIGTGGDDAAHDLATDGLGNVVIVGETTGALGKAGNHGSKDAFVAKYDGDGNLLWVRQLGTQQSDAAHGVATAAGNVILVGETEGALAGPWLGASDAFVVRLAP